MSVDSTPVFLYPIALDLRGRNCVVVGGGPVGARKAEALTASRADVLVVAPEVCEKMRELISADAVTYLEEPFMPAHLDHAFLAIAATDIPHVNQTVLEAARARDILVNLAAPGIDRDPPQAGPDSGDFVTMASVNRGDLLVAVTTGGAGPALSARLKREFEQRFGPEWADYVRLLSEMREQAKTDIAIDSERAAVLRRLAADDSIRESIAAGDTAGARRRAVECLS